MRAVLGLFVLLLLLPPIVAAQVELPAVPTLPLPDVLPAPLSPPPLPTVQLPAIPIPPPTLTVPLPELVRAPPAPAPARDDPVALPALPHVFFPEATLPSATFPLDPPPGTTAPSPEPPEVPIGLLAIPEGELSGPPAPVTLALGATAIAVLGAAFSRAWSWRAGLAAPLVPLTARFAKSARREDAERARVLAFLRERDGADAAALAEATGLPPILVAKHLQALETRGLVVLREERYHATGVRVDVDGPVLSQLQQRLLALLAERGPLPEGAVAALLDLGPQGARYHLRHLLATGHVAAREAEGETLWGLAVAPTRAAA